MKEKELERISKMTEEEFRQFREKKRKQKKNRKKKNEGNLLTLTRRIATRADFDSAHRVLQTQRISFDKKLSITLILRPGSNLRYIA